MLLCTFVCKFLYGHTVSFLGVELLGHIVILGFPGSSAGKESACNAGDPGLIPGSGRFPGEGIGYPRQYSWASLVAQKVNNVTCNMGDLSSIPGLRRYPGEGNGYPLHYSSLENSLDRGAW